MTVVQTCHWERFLCAAGLRRPGLLRTVEGTDLITEKQGPLIYDTIAS